MSRPSKPRFDGFVFAAIWLVAAAFLSIAMWRFGHRQMGGFDHSALVDTAWRMVSSQRPYDDFYLTTPIGFYMGAGLAFRMWGARWSALVMMSIIYALFSFLVLTLLMRSYAPRGFAIAVPLVCELLAMGIPSYWWYNSITAISACIFLTAAIAIVDNPASRVSTSLFALAAFLLMMMKPNTAGLLLLPAGIVLLTLRDVRRQMVISYVASGLAVCLLLAVMGIDPLDMARSYVEVARTRGLPSVSNFLRDRPGEVFVTIPLVLTCLVPLISAARGAGIAIRQGRAHSLQVVLISSVGVLAGVLGMFMNSDSNLVTGLPLIIVSAVSLMFWLIKEKIVESDIAPATMCALAAGAAASLMGLGFLGVIPSLDARVTLWGACVFAVLVGVVLGIVRCWRLPVALALLLLLLGGVALIFGETRVRVRYIGAGAFYSSEPLVEIPGIAFFQGFHVSPRLREVVEEVEEAVVDYGAQSEDGQLNVFFGPRMEFAYAAFRIQSPTQLPIWYHPGNSFPEGQIQAVSDSWLSHQFDVCIFLRAGESADFTYMPPDIVHSIETEYQRVDYPEIVVFTKE